MSFDVDGPKGKPILKRAAAGRIAKALPGLVKRFGRVSVTAAKALKPKPAPTAATRKAIVAYCRWAIEHEPFIHYAQVRPVPLAARRKLPLTTDCSGFATCAYLDAGAPDPNGHGFDPHELMFTGTLLQHGRRVTVRQAKAGDLVVFGGGTGHHVCVLLEDGRKGNPLLASHGQERGPMAISFLDEQRYQPTPATFLNYLGD